MTPPLRLAIATYALHEGGAEIWITSLCRYLDRTRVKPTVVAVCNPKLINERVRKAIPPDVAVVPMSVCRDQWPAFADVVLGWGLCELDKNAKGIRKVFCLHGAKLCNYTKSFIEDVKKSDAELTAVNPACLATLDAGMRKRVTIIPNGADLERTKPETGREATRERLNIAPNAKVVLYCGRVDQDKDVATIAKAVALLGKEWLLVVAGPVNGDPMAVTAHLSGLANEKLIYIAPRSNVGDWLAMADVFCLLSPSEAHPLAVTEAWAAGVPVVCSELPWLDDIESRWGPMANVVAFSPGGGHGPKTVARAILRSYGQDVSRRQRIAIEHYTAATMARRWEDYLLGEYRGMAMPYRLESVGSNIWIGSNRVCENAGEKGRWPRVIHINSPEQPSTCRMVAAGDLSIEFVEREPLGPALLQQITDYAKADGQGLLIHCAAGMCRSATAAIVALMARGVEYGEAVGRVVTATSRYQEQPIAPWLEHRVIEEIRRVLAKAA